ncbi:MAG: glycosyltransferase [Planctomycetia bacterium]
MTPLDATRPSLDDDATYQTDVAALRDVPAVLVHDWLTGMRGGEKVLEVFAELLPAAPLYTLVHQVGSVSTAIEAHRIETSILQLLPGAIRRYRQFLPLMPLVVDRWRLPPCRLVVSDSSCVAKSVKPPAGARHAAYLHSPMRYIYDRYDDYFAPGRAGWATRTAMALLRRPLQRWDRATTSRAHALAANSRFVARRIAAVYDRPAAVLPPPVDVNRFASAGSTPQDYYLVTSALVPYKNVETAVEAFRLLPDRRLVVAGSGPLFDRLKAAAPPNVELRGWVDDAEVVALAAGCRAFVMTSVEDFGIAPVEAMAAGRPVIALGEGGVLDTVLDVDDVNPLTQDPRCAAFGPTGIFYAADAPASLADGVRRFEAVEHRFAPDRLTAWADRFNRPGFKRRAARWLTQVLAGADENTLAADPPT